MIEVYKYLDGLSSDITKTIFKPKPNTIWEIITYLKIPNQTALL